MSKTRNACGEYNGTSSTRSGKESDEGYKGFLHIVCENCGSTHSFCVRQPIYQYRCKNCGTRMELENLTKMLQVCECGNRSRYMTNTREDAFDLPCICCGTPVAMAWNRGLRKYVACDEFDKVPKRKRRNRP